LNIQTKAVIIIINYNNM